MNANWRPTSAVAAVAIFVVAGVCGVVAVRVIRAVVETVAEQTPARGASPTAGGGEPGVFATTVASSIYSLDVDVAPRRTGLNTLHLYAYTPDHKPQRVVEWNVTAELPEQGIAPVAVPILPITEDHAVGQVNLSAPGAWQLHFTLRISDVNQATVNVSVPVKN
jgi:copper transport protein